MNDSKRWLVSDDRLIDLVSGPESDARAMAAELRAARAAADAHAATTATRDAEFVALRRSLWERLEQCQQQAERIRQLESSGAASAERVRRIVGETCMDEMSAEDASNEVCMRIATRAAEQLAGVGVGLSASDRVRLQSIAELLREQSVCWDMESALLDRLLASPPDPDCHAAAPTAPVIAARDPASLTEDEIRVARTAARADQEELIGVVHSCSDVLRYGDRMGPEVEFASRRRIRDYIASKKTVPIAAITALLDSDMPAGELRKALAEIVGLR